MCNMDVYFLRQLFILATAAMSSIAAGVMVAFPTALLPSLLTPNGTDITASANDASWISASNAIAGFPAFIVLPLIMQAFGRRIIIFIINCLLLIGWIIFVFADNIAALYAARITQGFVFGSTIIKGLIVSEYSAPKRRGYFLVTKKLSISVGVLLCHTFTLFWSWRQIAGFSILFNIPPLFMVWFWKESPAYLALKGRFIECKESYVWLFGKKPENLKEVEQLIAGQEKKTTEKSNFKKAIKTFLRRDFVIAYIASICLLIIVETSGRHYFMAYSVKIMSELFADKSVAVYFSVGIDVLTLIALLLTTVIVRYFNRRTLLFSFCSVSILLMLLISLLTYLRISNIATAVVILLFSFISNLGSIPLAFSMKAEIFSLEHRGLGSSLVGITSTGVYAVTLKVTPVLMKAVGLSGTFAMCAAGATVSMCILYFILPETKDKTLQEIEYEMKGIQTSPSEDRTMIPLVA